MHIAIKDGEFYIVYFGSGCVILRSLKTRRFIIESNLRFYEDYFQFFCFSDESLLGLDNVIEGIKNES